MSYGMSLVGKRGPEGLGQSQSATSKPVVFNNVPLAAGNKKIEINLRKALSDSTRQKCTLGNSDSIGDEVTINCSTTSTSDQVLGSAGDKKDARITEDDLMAVYFVDADVIAYAAPGTMLYEVAERNGVGGISVGCGQGSCGICEVEVKKFARDVEEDEGQVPGIVVRSCVTPVPRGDYRRIQVSEMLEDPIWGADGFDT
eukprot:jgi/Picsp_1/3043/NSC_01265-R1_ferredoxin [Chlamydomonas reinhardtii]